MSDLQIHRRRSIRLKGYDYTQPGVYFVTLGSFQREEIFGAVVNERVDLSALGGIILAEWFRSAGMRKEIRLFEDELVVMPNHVHGIVWIVEHDIVGADGVHPETGVRSEINPEITGIHPVETGTRPEITDVPTAKTGTRRVPLRMRPRSLSSFIAGFKAVVTSRAGRELNSANIWQRNYYEHIIRNGNELERIRNYMDSNPRNWHDDRETPAVLEMEKYFS